VKNSATNVYWVVSTRMFSDAAQREAGPFDTLEQAQSEMMRLGATGRYTDDFGCIPLAIDETPPAEWIDRDGPRRTVRSPMRTRTVPGSAATGGHGSSGAVSPLHRPSVDDVRQLDLTL